jgi:hypothetical protein
MHLDKIIDYNEGLQRGPRTDLLSNFLQQRTSIPSHLSKSLFMGMLLCPIDNLC